MRRAAFLASGVAIVALAVVGCGGSSSGAGKPRRSYTYTSTKPTVSVTTPVHRPPTAAAIVNAARLTGEKPGYQAVAHISITVPQFGSDPATAVGSGSFDPASGTGTLNLAVTPAGLLGLIGPLPTQAVIVGDALYLKVPPEAASVLQSSDQWLEGSVSGLGLSDSVDPARILSDTARDATRTVPDQTASVTLDPTTGLIHSLILSFYDPTLHAHIRVALRFTGFRAVSPAQAPPAAEVGDLAAAVQQLGF